MKMKKMKFSTLASRILVISGLFQSLTIVTHINMITNLYSTIIGFYMFGFVLFTILNILNGVNISSKKSMVILLSTYLVSIVQIAFGLLFVNAALTEVKTVADVVITNNMILSLSYIGVSILLTVIALILTTIHNVRYTEEYQIYM